MKQWVILGLAAIGAYAIYQWYQARNATATAGMNAQPGPQNPLDMSVVYPNMYIDNGLVSGVPVFSNASPVEAGHGDQSAAAVYDNPLSTMTGGYAIPFGPNVNRPTALESMPW